MISNKDDHFSILLPINLYPLMKTQYLSFLKSCIYEYNLNIPSSTPYIAPAICPAIDPTVSQSPPISAFISATSLNDLVCQTVCKAIARASIQYDPIQPGCCFNLVPAQVYPASIQFQFLSSTVLLNILNFLFYAQRELQSQSLSDCDRARLWTLLHLVQKPLHTFRRTYLPSVFYGLLMSSMMILPISLQHYAAQQPLWVVSLDSPQYSTPFQGLSANATGMGANLINDPFPLLNRSPLSVYGLCSRLNSLIEMEMFPPSPIECGLPPLFSPCYSHSWKRYLICVGLKLKSLSNTLSAMHRPIDASSVHTPIKPCLPYLISSNPCLMMPRPFLVKCWNSVDAPRASQIAMPRTAAIPRDYLWVRFSRDGEKVWVADISLKIWVNLSLSSSFQEGMPRYSLQCPPLSFLRNQLLKQCYMLQRS